MDEYMVRNNENAVRRSLLGTPPWLTETYHVTDNRLVVSGWAIPPDGRASDWAFLVNGRVPDTSRYPINTPSLAAVFPFCDGSGEAGFTLSCAITDQDRALGHIELQLTNRFSRLPSSDYFNQYIDLSPQLEIPDAEQLFRTQGNRSAERYRLHGYTTYKRIELAVYKHSGRRLQDFRSILDWGCGCGRLTQQLALRLPDAEVHGIDIDEPNVSWCKSHIPKAHFDLVPLRPPTQLNANTYDLIIGISVMTHLELEMQHEWLAELRRVAKPSGLVLLTTHGESALARVKNFEVIRKTLEFGNDDSTKDASLNGVIGSDDYYRASYHLRAFARALFGKYFEVVDIIPGGNASIQDILVLRKQQGG